MMSSTDTLLEITTTFPDLTTAQQITNTLIKEQLIACGNILPCHSHYMWEDKLNVEEEIIAHYKSANHLQELIEARIIALHPYELPCIIFNEIKANKPYARWVYNSIRPESR